MVRHVPSSQLVKVVENTMRHEGGAVVVDYTRMESKVINSDNREAKYSEEPYTFERSGHNLTIQLPRLEIYHAESDFKRSLLIDNNDIWDILETDFENV